MERREEKNRPYVCTHIFICMLLSFVGTTLGNRLMLMYRQVQSEQKALNKIQWYFLGEFGFHW